MNVCLEGTCVGEEPCHFCPAHGRALQGEAAPEKDLVSIIEPWALFPWEATLPLQASSLHSSRREPLKPHSDSSAALPTGFHWVAITPGLRPLALTCRPLASLVFFKRVRQPPASVCMCPLCLWDASLCTVRTVCGLPQGPSEGRCLTMPPLAPPHALPSLFWLLSLRTSSLHYTVICSSVLTAVWAQGGSRVLCHVPGT